MKIYYVHANIQVFKFLLKKLIDNTYLKMNRIDVTLIASLPSEIHATIFALSFVKSIKINSKKLNRF